jgi:hypothetical protein
MLWLPTASVDVVNVATPAPFNIPVPIAVPLSRNVTVPVATGVDAPPTSATIAVNVTLCPEYEGFRLEVTVVVVATTGVIVSVKTGETVPLKSRSPPYDTAIVSVPTVRVETVKVAVLLRLEPGTSTAVPSSATTVVGGKSSTKPTAPVGAA